MAKRKLEKAMAGRPDLTFQVSESQLSSIICDERENIFAFSQSLFLSGDLAAILSEPPSVNGGGE